MRTYYSMRATVQICIFLLIADIFRKIRDQKKDETDLNLTDLPSLYRVDCGKLRGIASDVES